MINKKLYFKYALVVAGLLAYAVIICLLRRYDHDEGMYISCANLVSKGFVPYRDFFYTHPPYFLYAIAPFMYLFTYKLLTVRLCSAFLGIVSAFLLSVGILYTEKHRNISLFTVVSAVCLVMLGAVTIYTQSLAWNHQLALFFASCGYWTFFYCYKKKNEKLFFVAGLAFALATGVRLPLVFLFILSWILLFVIYRNRKVMTYFSLGFVVGLIPLGVFLLLYTQEFIFSLLSVHTYTPMLFKTMGFDYSYSLVQKLAVFASIIIKNPIELVILIVFCLALFYFRFDLEARISFFFFAVCFFMFFLHTPVWPQYLYPLFMFTLPMISRLFQVMVGRAGATRYGIIILLVFALFIGPLDNYVRSVFVGVQPVPVSIHHNGKIIRSLTKASSLYQKAPVLTLIPIIVQEGGLNIYPEFATGPFVWRISTLLTDDERERLNIIDPANLGNFLHQKPPSAILSGFEERWEQPIIRWAQNSGYDPIELGGGRKLWIPHQRSESKLSSK
jgi:4-amino-4-deoxy-L-arabinose transferase-like glycosyltransferase